MPIMIREELADEHAAVHDVTDRAFGAHGENHIGELVDILRAGPARVSLVAVTESGGVAGHVMLSRGWVDAQERLVDVLILSPLSVEPSLQGQGIGRQLVQAAITSAQKQGAPALFLEGDPALYARFGFVAGASVGFTRPSVRIPEAAFQVMTLPARELWMTGALVYPEAFWVTDTVGLRRTPP